MFKNRHLFQCFFLKKMISPLFIHDSKKFTEKNDRSNDDDHDVDNDDDDVDDDKDDVTHLAKFFFLLFPSIQFTFNISI